MWQFGQTLVSAPAAAILGVLTVSLTLTCRA